MFKQEDCRGFDILNHAIHMGCAEDSWRGGVKQRSTVPLQHQSVAVSPPMQSSNSFQFPWKLHDMLEQSEQDGLQAIVAWQGEGAAYGTSFKVFKPQIFVGKLMPRYFKQTKYKSFQRQLNLYGFTRINEGPEKGGYRHKYFLKGNKALCQYISRQSHEDSLPTRSTDSPRTSTPGLPQVVGPVPVQMPVIAPNIGAFHDARQQHAVTPESSVTRLSPTSPSIPFEHNDIADQYKALIQKDYQFPWKLHEMLEKAGMHSYDHIVCWQPPGNYCFKVHDPQEFVATVMPRFFKQTKFKSFQRQLNLYGFARVDEGPNRGSYRHRLFQKGRKDLLSSMNRQKTSQNDNRLQAKTQDQEKVTTVTDASAIPKPLSPPNPISPNPIPGGTRNEPKCIDCGIPEALHTIQDGVLSDISDADASVSKPIGVTWRDPRSKSLSDWIIVVLHNDTFDKDSYNVHQRALAVGDRSSDYFARLFQNNEAGSSSESVLVLGTAEVEAFPHVLDYVYSGMMPKLNMKSAFSIFVLAKELEIHSLRQLVLRFYHESISKDSIGCFVQVAHEFEDEALLLAAVECCSKELRAMDVTLAGKLKPELLHQAILKCHSLPESQRCDDASICHVVAECLQAHAKSLTRDQLQQLTHPGILSSIDAVAAVKILALERKLYNRDHAADPPTILLRKRCVTSITRDWKRVRDQLELDQALVLAFKSVSSDVLFDILMQISGKVDH